MGVRSQVAEAAETPAWVSSESYWIPSHIVNSAWLTHGAFASWIVACLKPRIVVELGTHNGFSFFAFCEAAKQLGLPTQCFALDTWQGDDQTGFYSEQVFESVSDVSAREYPSTSTLLRGYFDDSLTQFDDGSIDLLHIDGRHTYEDVKHDFMSWLPKMSDRGVVLFHDLAEHENEFGVWKLWDELSTSRLSFSFEHGHGLGVLGVGDSFPEGLVRLFEAEGAAIGRIRDTYSELGGRIYGLYALLENQQRLAIELDDSTKALGKASEDAASAHAELGEIYSSRAWRLILRGRSIQARLPRALRAAVSRVVH